MRPHHNHPPACDSAPRRRAARRWAALRLRPLLLLPVLLGVLAGISGTGSALAGEREQPNIIFFITDDMLPRMFNFLPQGNGQMLTPNLDRLAAEGTIMMGQHVVSPVCTPSRYNSLTGRYASRAQNQAFLNQTRDTGQSVVQWNSFIVPGETTLATRLQAAGYATGMVGKNHVVDAHGLVKPDWEADPRDPAVIRTLAQNAEKVESAIRASGFDYAENIYHNNPDHNGVRELAVHNLDWVASAGLDFIDQNADRPFFLYFATTVPHGPVADPRAWNADPRATSEGYLDEPLDVMPARDTIPQRLKAVGLNPGRNVGNMLWLDDALGALIQRLEQHQILDNTIIVFFNDHGQTAKGTIYQGGVHNPSVVWRSQGFPCGGVSDAVISNVDFAPTILDWAKADAPDDAFDGKSFAPVLEGQAEEVHESIYFEMGYTRGVRVGDWKYVALRYPASANAMTLEERQARLDRLNANLTRRGRPIVTTDPNAPFSHIQLIPGGGDAERTSTSKYPFYYDADQLYNLAADPQEQTNLAHDAQHQDKLNEMKQALRAYLDDLPGGFAELSSGAATPE